MCQYCSITTPVFYNYQLHTHYGGYRTAELFDLPKQNTKRGYIACGSSSRKSGAGNQGIQCW